MLNVGAIIFARFICATILHLSLLEEVNGALQRMKYAINHPYQFDRPKLAFFISYLHFFVTTATEICNINIIITSEYPVDIVLNFIAIAIIAEFDNYVYGSLRNEYCKKLIEHHIDEKVLIVYHTTSKKCGDEELSMVKDNNGQYRPLRVKFSDRPCS